MSFSVAAILEVLRDTTAEPVSALPSRPKGGQLFCFKADGVAAQDWRADGHRWINQGTVGLPRKNPKLKKRYFYIATEDGASKQFVKYVFHEPRKETGPFIIQYVGNEEASQPFSHGNAKNEKAFVRSKPSALEKWLKQTKVEDASAVYKKEIQKDEMPRNLKQVQNIRFKAGNEHEYQFGKKRHTAHVKGRVPGQALTNRRGKTEVKPIADPIKKQQVRHGRKKGLFNKAYEYAVMIGDYIRLQIADVFYESHGYSNQTPASNETAPSPPNATTQRAPQAEVQAGCSNPQLSPRAVKVRTASTSRASTTDASVQCSLMEGVKNDLGGDKFCRCCGTRFENDTKKQQRLWLGCEKVGCEYWVHATCVLRKSPKITPKFCNTIPYLCPFHRF